MTGVFLKRENLERHNTRRTPCEDEHRDQKEAAENKEIQRRPAKHLAAKRKT